MHEGTALKRRAGMSGKRWGIVRHQRRGRRQVFARGGREGVFVLMLVVLVELYLLDDLIEKIVEKLVRVLVLNAAKEFVSIAKLVDKSTRRDDALICLMSGNVYVERAEGRKEGRRPRGDDEGWSSRGGGDVRGDLSALCFATGEDRGSGQQRWLCLSRYGGGYGWCGDVGRLDDKVAEGGTKVERLEHRVGVTSVSKVFETELLLIGDGDGRLGGIVGDRCGRGRLLGGSKWHPFRGLSYRHRCVARREGVGGKGKAGISETGGWRRRRQRGRV